MGKKNTGIKFASNTTALLTPAMEMKVCEPPKDKWLGTFKIRGAEIRYRSYIEDRDHALVEMMILIHQVVQEPYGIRLVDLVRL